MLLDVISVQAHPNHTLLLQFENGEKRRFVMGDLLEKRPFDTLKNLNLFLAARIEHGSVSWPNNIDIAPETLYDLSKSEV